MIKHAISTFVALALGLGVVSAETPASKTKKAADTAVEKAKEATDKAADKAKETTKKATDKKAEAKTEEPSESDKALLAHAGKESAKLTAAQKKDLLDLVNKGDDKALQTIPGVGEVKAGNIKKARPVKSVDDIIMIDGIGETTFDGIIKWTADGMKADAPADKPAEKKEAPKKADKPADKPAAKTKEKTTDKPADKPADAPADKPAKKKKGE